MAHLAKVRRGWQNEHLATFLLSRIAFVASPITTADDVGTDFLCTLFEVLHREGGEQLFPRNSFAIQIKSAKGTVDFTNKIEYLVKLELPFFLGTIDEKNLKLSIYSGEYLPFLFSEFGTPEALSLAVLEAGMKNTNCFQKKGDKEFRLNMPFVVDLSAHDNREDLLRKGRQLQALCSRMNENIAAMTSNEYILRLDNRVRIFAGPTSAKYFRRNFYNRLAEAFYNLEWSYESDRSNFMMEEFLTYERCYKDLVSQKAAIPEVLRKIYDTLKKRLSRVDP